MAGKYNFKDVGSVSLAQTDELPDVDVEAGQLSFDGDTLVLRKVDGQTTSTMRFVRDEYVDYVVGIDNFTEHLFAAWFEEANGGTVEIGPDPNAISMSPQLCATLPFMANAELPFYARTWRENTWFYPAQNPDIEFRFYPSPSNNFPWGIGLSNPDGTAVMLKSVDMNGTQVCQLVFQQSGDITSAENVTLPALGNATAYRMRLIVTEEGATLFMCPDGGTLTEVAELVEEIESTNYMPYVEATTDEGVSDTSSLVVDYCRWRALRVFANAPK